MKTWIQHFVSELDMVFLLWVFVVALVGVAVYATITMVVARLYFRSSPDKSVLEILRRSLVRLPFVLTSYGFLAGLGIYFGISLIDGCFPSSHPRSDGAETALVVFTLLGFFISVYTGCAVIYKASRTIKRENHDHAA
jgi:phage shock protein PspC (stress-responsive transcriptional regulator)